jgi:DNA-binding transcriptional ArsR family regulator
MVEYSRHLGGVFFALADPTRRAIVERLARSGRVRVTEIASDFPVSLNAVSKHLQVLERSGLLSRERAGREHYFSLDARALRQPLAWMEQQREFWERRLDEMEAMFVRRRGGRTRR